MNRDTELFVTRKELEQCLADFNQSLIVLRETVRKSTENAKLCADKVERVARGALSLITPNEAK